MRSNYKITGPFLTVNRETFFLSSETPELPHNTRVSFEREEAFNFVVYSAVCRPT